MPRLQRYIWTACKYHRKLPRFYLLFVLCFWLSSVTTITVHADNAPLTAGKQLANTSQTTEYSQSSTTLKFASGKQKVKLIELYTSQGCSSCPPAERWLNRLLSSEQLWHNWIPLAFHVTYWDYIGWQDPFATPLNDKRQYGYHHKGHTRAVYTPQFVLDGREWRGWLQTDTVTTASDIVGNLVATIQRGEFNVTFTPHTTNNKHLLLHVAVLGFDLSTAIPRGENSGHVLLEHFVVLNHRILPSQQSEQRISPYSWQGKLSHRISTTRLGVVFWVSNTDSLDPIQATGGFLPMAPQKHTQ